MQHLAWESSCPRGQCQQVTAWWLPGNKLMVPVDFLVSVLQKLPELILLPRWCLPKPGLKWLWAEGTAPTIQHVLSVQGVTRRFEFQHSAQSGWAHQLPTYPHTARCSGHPGIADMSITGTYKTHEGPGRRA